MSGYIIDEKNLIPAITYLNMAWETLGILQGEMHTEVSVVFEDVRFMRAIYIPKESDVQLTVMVQKGIFLTYILSIV